MSERAKIPRPTVKRLSLYLRELERAAEQNQRTIRSRTLGDVIGVSDAQVRKDLAVFGQLGHAGIGYRVQPLVHELRRILGTDKSWNAAVVGAGNIGRAVMAYGRFRRKGFEIVAVFDSDDTVVGREITGHRVRPMSDLPALVSEREIRIGIVAVPASAAQEVADKLIDGGVRGILNFAPVRLDVHDKVAVVSVDFSIALEQLAFQVSLGLTGSLDEAREQ